MRKSPAIRAALKGYEPTDEQWAAIAHPLVPVHLIAGAGAGKTAVMAARIVWAIENQDYLPQQILGLTFTNKAAEELQERVRMALATTGEHRPEDINVQTYNAFAAGVVREHGLLVGVEPEAGLLSEAQQWQLVLGCIDELGPFDAIELRSPGGIVRATLALASSIADHVITTSDVRAADERVLAAKDATPEMRETSAKRLELSYAVDAYTQAKQRSRRIDFGDQVMKAVAILEAFSEVRASYLQRYPVVLLDEYQDTNVAQRRLIQALVGSHGAVTAVGDARQAIYAFRGATMYNLIGFASHFPRAGDEVYDAISLSENFRSGGRILEVANTVVARIDPDRRPGAPLRPHEQNGEGKVSLGLFEDERVEAEYIASECERLHDRPAADGRDPVRWRDMAILVRRKATMEAILEVLEEHDIPVEVVGLSGLLKTPEVIEVVAWLRSLEGRPGANRWIARLLLGPRWRVHYRDLALCARWAAHRNHDLRVRLAGGDEERARDLEPGDVGFSLAEALDHLDEIEGLADDARARLRSFAERLGALRARSHAPVLELVQETIRRTGISDALDASSSRAAPAAKQNLANFLDHVASFAPVEGEATLRSFLAYLDAADAAEETLEAMQPAEQDSVKLMTVHSAKGLEFECVFVPSVAASKNAKGDHVWSVFPDTRGSNPLRSYRELPYDVREDRGHLPQWTGKSSEFEKGVKERSLEDERRLFYVALTRAKQLLYVTASWWYGRADREKGPSLFWEELRDLVDAGTVELVAEAEKPEVNPILDVLEGRREWPPRAFVGADDPVFENGWGEAADAVVAGERAVDDYIERLPDPERERVAALIAEHIDGLDLIGRPIAAGDLQRRSLPSILSATHYVALAGGSLAAHDLARPLPERPTNARRVGTEVHRLIEERARGIAPFADEGELDEPGPPSDGTVLNELMAAFAASGYEERTIARLPSGEPMVELPFALKVGDRVVRGRIDAVYEAPDGGLEIVDFKTGQRFEPGDLDQLGVYALALEANGLVPPGTPVTLTYLFLDGGPPSSRRWDGGLTRADLAAAVPGG